MADAVPTNTGRPTDPIGRTLDFMARLFAVAGAFVLLAMAFMSVYSIVGRAFFDSPMLGDYELVQMMSAVAVSLSLPFCQMVNGHVIVDFFTVRASTRTAATLDVIAALLMSVCAFAIAWRIAIGTLEFMGNRDASMLLNLPTWWGYAPMSPSFFLLGCAALYTAWQRNRERRSA